MYKIIGANQVQYGPVSADQLRQWIAEGRADANTQVQLEGTSEWKPLSQFAEFAASFAPVAPAGLPALGAGTDESARNAALQQVGGPAIALMVTAILGIAWSLFGMVMRLVGEGLSSMMQEVPPSLQKYQLYANGAGLIVGLLFCAFILFGAIKMKKLQTYGVCIAASIAAMIPCTPCPCCLLGLPFGIWALVVLNKPEVKEFFS